jgi:cytochrome c biogenesis factor
MLRSLILLFSTAIFAVGCFVFTRFRAWRIACWRVVCLAALLVSVVVGLSRGISCTASRLDRDPAGEEFCSRDEEREIVFENIVAASVVIGTALLLAGAQARVIGKRKARLAGDVGPTQRGQG